jgi:hypothetical protein
MPDLLKLEIAGVRIEIDAGGMDIISHADPAYHQFSESWADSPYDIQITLTKDSLPDTRTAKKVFDSGESWSLLSSKDDYFLIFKPPVFDEPYLIARMDWNISKAVIYCSRHLISEKEGGYAFINPVQYPLDQIMLMHYLARRDGIIIHAAGLEIAGKAYIFPGKSGAGKSTLSRQFAGKEGFHLLSDDRIIVRKTDNLLTAYGTPWPGDEGIASNMNFPLSGIFFISHGNANRIEPIGPQKALEKLLPVTSIPWYEEGLITNMLSLCEDLTNIPAYELYFKPETRTADFFRESVSG